MNLPADWAAIVKDYPCDGSPSFLAEQLYALHSKPRKELTVDEIEALDRKARENLGTGWQPDPVKFARDVIAAHEAKQREPETVTFRAARRNDTGEVRMLPLNFGTIEGYWDWMEPPQTFEVKLP